jgi:hypothetical protein
VYDLGLHVVWCPKHRRPVLAGRVASRLDELVRQKADERGWEIIALGAVSAGTVQKYIDTQWERPCKKDKEARG